MSFRVAYVWGKLGFLDGFGIFTTSPGARAPFSVENFEIDFFGGGKIEKMAPKMSFFGFSNFRPRKLLSIIYLNSSSCSTRLGRPDAHFTFEIVAKCPNSRVFDFSTKNLIFDP